jgi:hypothetical protein
MANMQGKVRQMVVGGAPAAGPMQSVAGSKGAQVIPFSFVYLEAYQAYHSTIGASSSSSSSSSQAEEELGASALGALVIATRPLRRSTCSVVAGSTGRINLRNNIRAGDASRVPLEFRREAADCRLFYPREILASVGEV